MNLRFPFAVRGGGDVVFVSQWTSADETERGSNVNILSLSLVKTT
jgi:hypothetical protein